MISIMLALNWTENSLKTNSDDIRVGEGKFQSHKQGMLSDSLINGEMTEEVKELRWRIYKILKHANKLTTNIKGYESDGTPIVETTKKKPSSNRLKKYKCDDSDDEFKLIMVVPNDFNELNTVEALDKMESDEIDRASYLTKFKTKGSILINRSHTPAFNIENYTDKLLIREISDKSVLLEFYVSKYPTEDKRSRLAISEFKKILNGKHRSPVLDFDNVFFITDKAIGSESNLEYYFNVNKFHRIVEYAGNYVIKFVAEKVVFGDDILEKYRMSDLDEKYEKKERK
jgi:hypothetical protein